ncbi:hypothetical protein EAL2_c21210 [Peptoclostridium acidaminophilum DSM 3953]|uniref:Uncharacterized protein n=1 Tax=Peptoclostridium acidaminophilum DSM 3953 TaxID=1286171 RepID=W8TMG9_PEPAC|nr:hypothetical protein [Peptoclostridium acidaminophilum]AHM57402.1 hypothetical protein EAL2_c21210 [Peptoclostridium acidaminophilum DSM 3953]
MCRVMSSIDNFKVLQTGRDYVVVNASGGYENHSHFESYKGAVTCIDLIKRRKVPKSSYLIKAAMRLTTDSDYRRDLERIGEKRLQKQRYINIGCKGR